MKVITTCSDAGFEQYGRRWIDSIENWPSAAEFVIYGEGTDIPDYLERMSDLGHGLGNLTHNFMPPRCDAFKAKYQDYKPPSWRFDVVKFCNKVFAAYDALYNHDGLGVWLDADAVTYRQIPEGYIESLLPEGCYLAHFKRHHYTETGFWLVDCRHPEHKAFFDYWIGLFESGKFQQLPEWHDCTTLDATIRAFKGRAKTHSLSGEFEGDMHPMSKVDLAKYIDHCKGPRKDLGYSPENVHREAA
jgi:hypothetical protein